MKSINFILSRAHLYLRILPLRIQWIMKVTTLRSQTGANLWKCTTFSSSMQRSEYLKEEPVKESLSMKKVILIFCLFLISIYLFFYFIFLSIMRLEVFYVLFRVMVLCSQLLQQLRRCLSLKEGFQSFLFFLLVFQNFCICLVFCF